MKSEVAHASNEKDESEQKSPPENVDFEPFDQVAKEFVCMIKCMEREIDSSFEG